MERLGLGPKRPWLWLVVFGAALVVHGGTALVRTPSLVPPPTLLDFGSYYAGAWDLRHGQSPYAPQAAARKRLRSETGLSGRIPAHHSPPAWPLLLRPLSHLSYPIAATGWLLLLLGLATLSSLWLARLAGLRGPWALAVVGVLTLSFGPVFLNLTLGQNGLFLLVAALALGRSLEAPTWRRHLAAAGAFTLAVAAKLFPVLWVVALARRRLVLLAGGLVVGLGLVFALPLACQPTISTDYYETFLPARARATQRHTSLDDQSLPAYLDRLGRAHTFRVPGLRTSTLNRVAWRPPWEIPRPVLRGLAMGILLLLGVGLLWLLWRAPPHLQEAALYLVVLFALLPVPHLERYNHVLLLPALAWLWGHGGPTGRHLAIAAYGLAAVARLSHLWALTLPSGLAVLLSGAGLTAVAVLGIGLVCQLRAGSMDEPPAES